MGAVITAGVTHFRTEFSPLDTKSRYYRFCGCGRIRNVGPRVTFTDEEKSSWAFDNLYVIQLDVDNRGNQDKAKVDFGITLLSDAKAIFVVTTTQDHYHKAQDLTKASPSKPINEIYYTLEPFNRRNKYSFKIYEVTGNIALTKQDIQLNSKKPVIFVERPRVGVLTNGFAERVATEVIKGIVSRYS